MANVQRARMLAAMAEVVCERGAAKVTVADVVGRSGVSRRTFYEIFEDRDSCFLAAFDDAVAAGCTYVLPAYSPTGAWTQRMRRGLEAVLAFFDAEPHRGQLLVIEALAAGPCALKRRQEVLSRLVAAVEEGRSQAPAGADLPALAAEGVVGSVLAIVHARMLQGGTTPLLALASQLMAMIVLPYRGVAAARRELARPPSSSQPAAPSARRDPLADLGMRLTYRTIRVLTAIGQVPGSSNRLVADAAGVADAGQISKLLARLHQLGLIEKAGTGPARGEPNAWRLTPEGHAIQRAIATQSR